MSRIIQEHRVFGKEISVVAADETEARGLVQKKITGDYWIWEIKRADGADGLWVAYVAKHEDCFACND